MIKHIALPALNELKSWYDGAETEKPEDNCYLVYPSRARIG